MDISYSPDMQRNCSVHRLLDTLGDGWSFLLLRAAFFGISRFDDFIHKLGAPRVRVANSLRKLTEADVLAHESYGDYRLTEAGHDLFGVCIGLMRWGDVWAQAASEDSPPITLRWRDTGETVVPQLVCGACRQAIDAHTTHATNGPGAGMEPKQPGRKRPADPALFARAEPCSVARALKKFGDTWSFLVLREAFFGTNRFDEFALRLSAPRNVLTQRLKTLVAEGLLTHSRATTGGKHAPYSLTEAGLALYPVIVAMIAWGDRWLAGPEGAPLILTHTPCGHRLTPVLIDSRSGRLITDREVYPTGPGADG